MKIFKQVAKSCGLIVCAFFAYLGTQLLLEIITLLTYYMLYASVGIVPSYDATLSFVTELAMPLSFCSGVITLTLLFAAPVLFRRSPLKAYRVTAVSFSNTWLLLLFGLSASVVVGFLWEIIPFPESAWEIYNETVGSMLAPNTGIALLAVVLMAPIVEELLCRAILIGQFSKFMPKWVAVIVSAAIFGIIHGNLIQGTYAFVCGLLLGAIYLRFRSVTASILFHVGFNASSFVLSAIPDEPAPLAIVVLVLFCGMFVLCAVSLWQATAKNKLPPF